MEQEAVTRALSWSPRPIAMLSLDGGGVRGLSSLLILRLLLVLVTQELVQNGVIPEDHATIRPHDIFDVAVGTSTGGLIVLMLVKMDLTLDECVEQYKELSQYIFSKQRPLLKRIFGSDWSKFSGKRLQTAVEKLLSSRGQPDDLKLRCVGQENSLQGTVLCHELPRLHCTFLCSNECRGPYRQHMLTCDLQVRQAARATSAAPSYFKPMIIQERAFVDGGYGENNNPSWEGKLHYEKNHDLEQALTMVNIGTGSLPREVDEDHLPRRPWWTRFLPNALVEAFGLISDLVKMATDSENVANHLHYLSESHPEQLFFERFSADTGIHSIKLDNWRAATGPEGSTTIEVKTEAYLSKPEVQDRMRATARKLAEVYRRRHERNDVASFGAVENPADVELSIPIIVPDIQPPGSHRSEDLGAAAVGEGIPSLISGSEPTQSPGPSRPLTPDPALRPLLAPLVTVENREILQGQGEQFAQNKPPPSLLLSVSSPNRSPSRKSKRAATYPPRSNPVEDD